MEVIAAARNPTGATYHRSLDGLRGLAAVMVAYGHAGHFGGKNSWVPLVTGCATIGVILFFFLSGFLMAHHYVPKATLGIFTRRALKYWAAFLLRRAVRVYPPFLFAPIVGYLLLMPRFPPDFQRKARTADFPVFDELLKLLTFRGELGIYWTVEVELFFYLLFPVAITACLVIGRKAWMLLALFLVLMVLNHFPYGVGGLAWHVPLPGMWTGYISIFIAGAFAAIVAQKVPGVVDGKRPRWSLPWNALALIGIAALAVIVALVGWFKLTQAALWQLEWMFAALFLVLFVSLVRSDGLVSRLLASRVGVALGRVSYSLYLMHLAAYYFAKKYFDAQHWGMLAAVLALLLLVPAYHLLFEWPFVRLSKMIAVNGGGRTPWSTVKQRRDATRRRAIARLERKLGLAPGELADVQLTIGELSTIAKEIRAKPHCALLVFGCGHDSLLWEKINRGGTTVFIEDDPQWAATVRTKLVAASVHEVHYGTRQAQWLRLLHRPSQLDMALPPEVEGRRWDVILVDGPAGFSDEQPGRMKSIYAASRMVAPGGRVFVHDCDRPAENEFASRYLGRHRLFAEVRGRALLRGYAF